MSVCIVVSSPNKRPKKIEEALQDPDRIIVMQEELNQFERNKVWKLVPKTKEQISHWCEMGVQKQVR